jgi:hypothetical protein
MGKQYEQRRTGVPARYVEPMAASKRVISPDKSGYRPSIGTSGRARTEHRGIVGIFVIRLVDFHALSHQAGFDNK